MSRKKKILVSFILDETGSMFKQADQVISAFNEYVSSLALSDDADNIRFTLTQFNNQQGARVVHDKAAISKVPLLNKTTYSPNAATPLYDAIGQTVLSLEKGKKRHNRLVVIQTDGYENCSVEFSRDDIFKLIELKKKEGWTFAFLGADQDAYAASASIGISHGNTLNYASAQSALAFASAAQATRAYTSTGGAQTENLFNNEEDDDE